MCYWSNRCVKVLAGPYERSSGVVVKEEKESVTVRIVTQVGFDRGYSQIKVSKNDLQTID